MKNEMNMKLPANCAMMGEDEMMDVNGGGAIETAAKAVIAVGGALGLTAVAGVAAKGILSIFNPNGWGDIISGSIEGGKNFIDGAVSAGANFLNKLMGISTL